MQASGSPTIPHMHTKQPLVLATNDEKWSFACHGMEVQFIASVISEDIDERAMQGWNCYLLWYNAVAQHHISWYAMKPGGSGYEVCSWNGAYMDCVLVMPCGYWWYTEPLNRVEWANILECILYISLTSFPHHMSGQHLQQSHTKSPVKTVKVMNVIHNERLASFYPVNVGKFIL